MALTIGMMLPPLTLKWSAGVAQTFAVRWRDSDGNDYDLTGVTVRLVISTTGGDVTLNASVLGAYSTWTFTAGQSIAGYIGRPVRLEWEYAAVPYLMSQGVVVPS